MIWIEAIKQMNSEEMAETIVGISTICQVCVYQCDPKCDCKDETCIEGIQIYLESEVR